MNRTDYSASCNGQALELSRTEFDLLYLLITNPGRTCTKSIIYDTVWGIGYRVV